VPYANPHEVTPPTGEPEAGDLPVLFGGRGGAIQCTVPAPTECLLKHRVSSLNEYALQWFGRRVCSRHSLLDLECLRTSTTSQSPGTGRSAQVA
jgi:hypothetical protein